MPRPRLTIRVMIGLVALTAVALAALVMIRRSNDFRAMAVEQRDTEELSMSYADDARGPSGDRQRVARGEQMAAYHRALRLKYERAARYPWLAPEQDPPIPEPPGR